MASFFGFIGGVLTLLFWLAVILVVVALLGYNKLRKLSEDIREAWSNIGVVGKKQVSLINQLIDVVKGYQESEKLVMLKVSDDLSTAASVANLHQQSGMVLSAVNGMAQRFPDLKSNEQYQRLIDSIQKCEEQLEDARQSYNSAVKKYNTHRSSIPHVLYATTIGFKVAPYLEFQADHSMNAAPMQSFTADEDGERLNALLGAAGASAKKVGALALSGGKELATKAIEGGKVLVDTAQEKAKQLAEERERRTAAQQYHYLDKDKNPAGPVSRGELQRLFADAKITADTMVLPAGSTQWVKYEQIAEQAVEQA